MSTRAAKSNCSRSRIDDLKCEAFPRSSAITVAYFPPCFVHDSSINQRTLRSAYRCADTMNRDVTANENNSSRELRNRSVSSVVESLSHRNMHYFVWPCAFVYSCKFSDVVLSTMI
ncbi:hypothetical protein AVEN_248364-1 [Araneus ventricosus]|uniref:Uncharacterized protein n=1 Tax=Araneus ventricosus TaxID=182803 RepID=A0A4Y2MFN4_ARAVE|nr:hypothetical protein AVEN_248364-1 [Araneus ventricosus]